MLVLCLPEQTAPWAVFVLTASDPKAVLAVNFSAAEDPSQISLAMVSYLVEAGHNPMGYAGVVEGRHREEGRYEERCQGFRQAMQPGLLQLALDVNWVVMNCLAKERGYQEGELHLVKGRQEVRWAGKPGLS